MLTLGLLRVCARARASMRMGIAAAFASAALLGQVPARPNPAPQAPSPRLVPPISEGELSQQLVGKTFYLRGAYRCNSLHFSATGKLDGESEVASHTLSLIEVTHVHLTKHRLELEGARYGLHYLGALPSEDQSEAVDRVLLTTKKKPVRIAIDREEVLKAGKERHPKSDKARPDTNAAPSVPVQAEGVHQSGVDERGSLVALTDGEANRALQAALDTIFAPGIDKGMAATLPDYWQLYYRAVAAKTNYSPADPSIYRLAQVDEKPRLLTAFDPPSNEYAQNNGVAGLAMYHVVVDAQGTPREVAVGRPIGFGLDENAVDAIRKARFAPAMKEGKPVSVIVDVTVQFRILSKRTAASTIRTAFSKSSAKSQLPGPYSIGRP